MNGTGEDERTRTKAEGKPARNVSLPHLKHLEKFSKASSRFISSLNRFYFTPGHIYAVYQVQEIHMSKGELATDS